MITIDDILKIDNLHYSQYSKYIAGDFTDKNPSHYISYPLSDEIYWSDLQNTKTPKTDEDIEDIFITHGYMQYGDYDNSCMVERSNYKLFMEEYGDLNFVFKVFGGYGSTAIALSLKGLLNPDNEDKVLEIIELLNGLNDYPCIDDEDMSNMEYESFMESFNDYGYKDSMTALSKKFNLDIYDYYEEKFKEILLEADRNLNYPSYMIESGGICYIDIDRLIEGISLDLLKTVLIDYEVKS